MVPADRNLTQAQLGQMRQINQFNVETEAIDLRRLYQRPADTHPKSLEAALRVPKRKCGSEPDYQIKYAAALFAPPGLMKSNQSAIQRAGTKRQIVFAALNRLDHFRCFRNRA